MAPASQLIRNLTPRAESLVQRICVERSEEAAVKRGTTVEEEATKLFKYTRTKLAKNSLCSVTDLCVVSDTKWGSLDLPISVLHRVRSLVGTDLVLSAVKDGALPCPVVAASGGERLVSRKSVIDSSTSEGGSDDMDFMPIDQLFWSHDKIYDHFSDDRSVFETVCDLLKIVDIAEHNVRVSLLPALRVVDLGGRMYTLSNRRLFALREFQRILTRLVGHRQVWAPIIKVAVTTARAFTTECSGEWVSLTRPVKMVFKRHDHGPRHFSQERVRSLSRGASVNARSLSRTQRSVSRAPMLELEATTIPMPEIVEDEPEDTVGRGHAQTLQRSGSRGRSPQKMRHRQLQEIDEPLPVLRGPWDELGDATSHVDAAPAHASRRGRSLQRNHHSDAVDEQEPWWLGVARRPHVPEEKLSDFVSQWQLARSTAEMLRRLQPGLLYYVIRDFAPPANRPGVSRFGYDGILNKFVKHAEWKLEQETSKRKHIDRADADSRPWRRTTADWQLRGGL